MPTSNGQVGRFDIRKGAVTAQAIRENSVITEKVLDLAVTTDKLAEPFTFALASNNAVNQTLDGTYRIMVSVSVDVPAWAGQLLYMASGFIQVSGTGGNFQLGFDVNLNSADEPSGAFSESMFTGETHGVRDVDFRRVTAPGATVSAYLWAKVNSGTSPQNTNFSQLELAAVFAR